MTFLALMNWDGSNRVSKYAEFATLTEAQTHAAQGGTLPGTKVGAFAAAHPSGMPWDWSVNAGAGTVANAPDLPKLKAKRKAEIVALLEKKIAAGRNDGTNTWQIDTRSQGFFAAVAAQLARLKLNPHNGKWRNRANVDVTLNDAQMGAVIDDVFTYCRDLMRTATTHKDSIQALVTVADVNAYDITTNWPANPPV